VTAWITAAASVLVALLAGLLTYRNNQRLGLRQDQLARVNAQLEEFYGPLLALSQASNRAWLAFRRRYRPGGPYFDGTETEADRNNWVHWMREVFIPTNRRIYEIIVTKAHLLDDDEMPPCLLDLCAHVAGYEAMVKRWDKGDTTELTSLLNHPSEPFLQYVSESFARLKHLQQELLRSNVVRNSRRGRGVGW
jgi:hypothetical protein